MNRRERRGVGFQASENSFAPRRTRRRIEGTHDAFSYYCNLNAYLWQSVSICVQLKHFHHEGHEELEVKRHKKKKFYHEGHEAHEEKTCFDKQQISTCVYLCSSASHHRIFTIIISICVYLCWSVTSYNNFTMKDMKDLKETSKTNFV